MSGASNNTIGGPAAGAGNTIADNFGPGILIVAATGTVVTNNAIASNRNGGVVIDFGSAAEPLEHDRLEHHLCEPGKRHQPLRHQRHDDHVEYHREQYAGRRVARWRLPGTPSFSNSLSGDGSQVEIDLLDGADNSQPAPALTSATSSGGSTTLLASLQAAPNTSYLIQLFSSPSGPASGPGTGQTLLNAGASPITTDSTGRAVLNVTLPVAVAAGLFLDGDGYERGNG